MREAIVATAYRSHQHFHLKALLRQYHHWATALATSLTSARVGRGFSWYWVQHCVAVITGLPIALHFLIGFFLYERNVFKWNFNTHVTSEQSLNRLKLSWVSSMLSIPSVIQSLGKIWTCSMCFSSNNSRISKTSWGLRTKLAAIKLISLSKPKRMSLASFSVIPGRWLKHQAR